MEQVIDTEFGLTPPEVCATIEALYEAIQNRFHWTVMDPELGSGGVQHWQKLEWDTAKSVIDLAVQAYTKAFMTLKSWPDEMLQQEFVDAYTIPEEVWDLLAEISNAKDWDHVPRHEIEEDVLLGLKGPDDCPVCRYLFFG